MNVHGLRRNVKNVVRNYTDAQIKVREATSNDPWGPSGTLMSEIADLTYNVVAFSEIMYVLWKRLNDHGKNWKHVYKALVLMEYLLKSGSEKVAQQCKERVFVIETLKDFQYIEENKDQGVNVREKAKQLVALLKDDERLKDERARALKARERFAQATAGIRREVIQRDQNSTEFVSRPPYNDEFMSEGIFVSELEQVRPQTIGEEELQLQLALAMSKEEADQSERLKRNDELRLQMALSESKESFVQCSQPANEPKKEEHSAMQDLLDIFSTQGNHHSVTRDPWGMPIEPTNVNRPRYPHSYTLPSGLNQNALPAAENTDPNLAAARMENNNAVNLNSELHSPDLVSSTVNESGSYDLSGLRKSLSADIAINDFGQQRSPQRFLGDNANLVNLDSLIEFRTPPPASAFTSSPNPFQAARPSPPSINQIRVQNNPTTTTVSPSPLFTQQCPTNQTLNNATTMPSNNPFL